MILGLYGDVNLSRSSLRLISHLMMLQYVDENIGVMSVGFLLPSPDDAVIWRGPKKHSTCHNKLCELMLLSIIQITLVNLCSILVNILSFKFTQVCVMSLSLCHIVLLHSK